jgi:hypothetical protein
VKDSEVALRKVLEVCLILGLGCAQAVSRRPLAAEARVRAWVNPCGICGGKNCTGTGNSPSCSVFPCQCSFTVDLHSHISSGERTIGPLEAAV